MKKVIDVNGNNFSEKRGITTNKTYSFVGYDRKGNPIYAEYETMFSVVKGIIKDKEFTGRFVNEKNNAYEYIGNGLYAPIN